MADTLAYTTPVMKAVSLLNNQAERMTRVGTRMALAITAPLALMANTSIKEFAAFDNAITQSLAIAGKVTEGLRREMEQNAIAISRRSITSAVDLAKSYYYLISAGYSARQALHSVATVERFAVAGAFELERATTLLADSQAALGLNSKNTAEHMKNLVKISDVLIKANIISNATTEQFARALTTKSAAALRLLNKDMEEGVAVLAALASQGVKAELAGEQLYIVLRDLQAAALDNRQAWGMFGLSVYDMRGKMRPIVSIVEQLERLLGGLSDQQKKMVLSTLGFTDRSVAATYSLLGMSKQIREYEKDLRKAGGSTEHIANEQLKSFSAQMDIMRNKVVAARIEIGRLLAPALGWLNQQVEKAINYWNTFNDTQKRTILVVAGVVAVIGPLLLATAAFIATTATGLGMVVTYWAAIKVGVALVWAALTGVLGVTAQLLALFIAVGVAVAAITALVAGPEGLVAAWHAAKEATMVFFYHVFGFMSEFRDNVAAVFVWFGSYWESILRDAVGIFVVFAGNIAINTRTMVGTIVELIGLFVGTAYRAMYDVWMALPRGIAAALIEAHAIIYCGLAIITLRFWEMIVKIKAWWKSIFTGESASVDAVGMATAMANAFKKDLSAQFGEGFNSGFFTNDFTKAAGGVIDRGLGSMRGVLEGFTPSTPKAPELKYADFIDELFGKKPKPEEKKIREKKETAEKKPFDFGDDVGMSSAVNNILSQLNRKGKTGHDVGDDFKQISLRRFVLDGPGGLSAAGRAKGQKVEATGVENRLDTMIELMQRGSTGIVS